MVLIAAFWGCFRVYRENIVTYLSTWLKQRSRKALQHLCFSPHRYSDTTATFLSVISHEVCCVLLVNEPFLISNRVLVLHRPKLLAILFIALTEKHRNRCRWWSLKHAGLCFCHICNFLRWSPSFIYWKQMCAHTPIPQGAIQRSRWEEKLLVYHHCYQYYHYLCICTLQCVGLYTDVCASYLTLHKKALYTPEKIFHTPFLPSNQWILGSWHKTLKRVILRREGCGMTVSHVHTNTSVYTEKRNVWDAISCVLVPKNKQTKNQLTPHFWVKKPNNQQTRE